MEAIHGLVEAQVPAQAVERVALDQFGPHPFGIGAVALGHLGDALFHVGIADGDLLVIGDAAQDVVHLDPVGGRLGGAAEDVLAVLFDIILVDAPAHILLHHILDDVAGFLFHEGLG